MRRSRKKSESGKSNMVAEQRPVDDKTSAETRRANLAALDPPSKPAAKRTSATMLLAALILLASAMPALAQVNAPLWQCGGTYVGPVSAVNVAGSCAYAGGIYTITPATGTVTSVTASTPLASSGGATPNISLTGITPVANGGTAIASYTVGDLLYASGATTLSRLTAVALGRVLASGGAGTAFTWEEPGGDVAGAIGSLTVGGIQGRAVSNAAPAGGDVIAWNAGGGGTWEPTTLSAASVGADPAGSAAAAQAAAEAASLPLHGKADTCGAADTAAALTDTNTVDKGGTGLTSAGGSANRVLVTTDGAAWSVGQVTGSMVANTTLQSAQASMFVSASATVCGAGATNVAHGLGRQPGKYFCWLVYIQTGVTTQISAITADATNIAVTCTSGAKVQCFAW